MREPAHQPPGERLAAIHATPTWLPRTQTWMYNQARFLPDRIETHIVCERTANLDAFDLPNIHCHSDQSLTKRFLDRSLRKLGIRRHMGYLTDVARDVEAALVHSHFGLTAWRNIEAVRNANARHVVSFYGADVTQAPRRYASTLERYATLFETIDTVFCEGNEMARRISELGCPGEKIEVHHLGVNLDDLPYRPRKWRRPEPFRVLMAATFREKKGLPYAIRALGEIGDEADLEITIVGDATAKPGDQEEKQRILAAIDDAGLTNQTRFTGFQSHTVLIEEAYRHHVFLSPSVSASDGDTEGGAPVSIIEMAASGMPIVSSFHCDIPEVVIDGETGWLAPEKDWHALASHLVWLISHPEDWEDRLRSGREHIESEYDCRKQGERLATHYARLVADR